MRRLIPAAAAASLLVSSPAHAHDLAGYVSPAGIGFFEAQLPDYVPRRLAPPPMTQTLFTCPGGRPVNATQYDTVVDIDVHSMRLSVPRAERLRLDMVFSVWGQGKLYLENPFVCFGSTTCNDDLAIIGARAVLDFDVAVGADGRPEVRLGGIYLDVGPDDVSFYLSGCAIDDIVNWVIGFAKGWFLDYLLDRLEAVAAEVMAPMLSEVVAGFTTFEGTVGVADISAAVESLSVRADGVRVGGDVALSTRFPADACVGPDPGAPASHAGDGPNLAAGAASHLGISVNLGLVDDVVYHVWREGMACFSEQHLRALGIAMDLDHVAQVLPGFPTGTSLSLEASFARPPRVVGEGGDGAALRLVVQDATVDLVGQLPGGGTAGVHVQLDAEAVAGIGLDPDINALVLEVGGVTIKRLVIDSDAVGLDAARLRQVLEQVVLPPLFEQLGQLPVTGPIFGFADYYLILRDVGTTAAHAWAKADLFRAPANDRTPPETWIERAPTGVVAPAQAVVRVGASDAEVPAELLRYRIRVDGVERPLTYVRELAVGEVGRSASYDVEVSAVDLAGNADPTPARVTVTVDGIAPQVALVGERVVRTEDHAVSLAWIAADDLTPAERLVSRIELYRMSDPADILSGERLGHATLAPGVSAGTIELDPGALYRIEIHVRDEAGNEGVASYLVNVLGGGGGCRATPVGGAGATWLLLATLALLAAPRRRTRTPRQPVKTSAARY